MSSGSTGAIEGHDTSQVSQGVPRALGKRKKPSGGRSGRVRAPEGGSGRMCFQFNFIIFYKTNFSHAASFTR
eukprot:7012189-Prymnesium_polylepis.1